MVYLKTAATGPVPRPVIDAPAEFYRELMEEGDRNWEEWVARREGTRKRIAEMINADAEEIAFAPNTSTGMNVIVDALEGTGEVISSELEFPVTTVPWLHRGIRVHLLRATDGEVRTEDVRSAMSERTKIIALSHVQYSNGFRLDLEVIGRNKGDHFLIVNASQSAGVLPIDVKRMRIDALCATGHKWMLAGLGTGFLYLSRELLERTRPRAVGWMSVEDAFGMRNNEFKLRADAAARIELGVPQFASIFALGAASDYLMELKIENIERRALELNRYLTNHLIEAGWKVLSPIANEKSRSAETLVHLEQPSQAIAHLLKRGVDVTRKPEGIRVATDFFNNEADIERLIEALNEMR
ncbi:MAG: aminotransferase class V-fold PLP-dependent enzyme [Pyrinomonadaceae bacterium]|nr:aminotransferase class V-fold PLP-dependent enzyme [Pyrinomonadaceae bacterium]